MIYINTYTDAHHISTHTHSYTIDTHVHTYTDTHRHKVSE